MAIIRGPLANIATLPSTLGAIYTNAASTKTFIKGVSLFNGNTSPEVVKLYNVPNSGGSVGTAGATNQFTEISLVAKETFFYEFPGDGNSGKHYTKKRGTLAKMNLSVILST